MEFIVFWKRKYNPEKENSERYSLLFISKSILYNGTLLGIEIGYFRISMDILGIRYKKKIQNVIAINNLIRIVDNNINLKFLHLENKNVSNGSFWVMNIMKNIHFMLQLYKN